MRTQSDTSIPMQLNSVTVATRLALGIPIVLTLCSVILWAISLPSIDVLQMNDLGLVSVLPASVFVACILLIASFSLTLHQGRLSLPILLLHLIGLIFMLYGTTTIVEDSPRFAVSWRHVGVTEHITRTGNVDPHIDAYFNWPVFFIASAFVTDLAGFQSALSFTPWASVYFNLLYFGPLMMLLSTLSTDKRVVWLGVWFFYLTNWIGQDYFAPQALNYFLYLVILAVLVTWFKAVGIQPQLERIFPKRTRAFRLIERVLYLVYGPPAISDEPKQKSSPAQRMGLLAIVITLFVVAVPSHQLTPFAILASVTGLIVLGRCTPRGLPIIMALVIVTWMSFMTTAYLSGHFTKLTQDIGQVNNIVDANVAGRLKGSAEHLFIVYLRLFMTLVFWVLALIGGLRRFRKGYKDLTPAVIATAPFILMVMQPYGGEMLLRAYLFSLPAMAFFAAVLVFPTLSTTTSWRTTAAIGLVSSALLVGFLFARYGNERMDHFTAQEVEAVNYLYQIAEPNSILAAAWGNLPWKFQDYEEHKYRTVMDELLASDVNTVADMLRNRKYPNAYLILTRSQKAYAELFRGLPPGQWESFEKNLLDSPEFRLIFANEEAKIFILNRDQKEALP